MPHEKTLTEIEVKLLTLETTNSLLIRPDDYFRIELFFACSRTPSKSFRLSENKIDFVKQSINNHLHIRNVVGDVLEFWLMQVNGSNKIIVRESLIYGYGTIEIAKEDGERTVEFKLENELFARLTIDLIKSVRSIEKHTVVEPDEDLLKKVVDPHEEIRRKEESEAKRLREQEEQEEIARQQKRKPAITLTTYNKKDEPYT